MFCFNCGYKYNADNLEKCSICGMSFKMRCNKCGSGNPKFARFCVNCGSELAQTVEEAAETRKQVAVIFADISGFTKLSETLDPEDVRELINDCFEYITRPVYELEGTIDKYIGDCVMILFGAKYSHSDDAKRAVKCAFSMMKHIEEFSKERSLSENLKLSIGINYGLVAAGKIGSYYDKDYTVMGDVVNTAQRLQSSASSGSILVSKSIYDATNDIIHYSEGRDIVVKNKRNPLKCYTPISIKYEDDYENIKLYDREKELSLLNEAVLSGRNLIEIYGKPGSGKSSLVKKVYLNLERSFNKIWVDCNIMFSPKPYNTLSNIILSILNIKNDDSQKIKRTRLESYLDFLMKDHDEEAVEKTFNYMTFILGLERDIGFEKNLNSMNYQDIKRELADQTELFLRLCARRQRHIIVVDDLQWADEESRQVLYAISVPDAAFILVSHYKQDKLKDTAAVSVDIGNISKAGVHDYIVERLGCEEISGDMLEAFVNITDGNPLYVREITNTVKHRSLYNITAGTAQLKEEAVKDLPSTLENAVYSSYRDLSAGTAKFLEAASIIGKDFSVSMVMKLLDLEGDAVELLKTPVMLNIISFKEAKTSHVNIDRIYTFTQEIHRTVIYNSIMKKNRRDYHKKLAGLLENDNLKDLEGYLDIIAMHYNEAGILNKAAIYYYKAAEKYKGNYMYSGAIDYYKKYIDISGALRDEKVLGSLTSLGDIYNDIGEYENALAALNNALERLIISEDKNRIRLLLAEIHKNKGDFPEALAIIDELQPRLRKDSSLYGKLLQIKCNIYFMLGKNEYIEISMEAEEILTKIDDISALALTLGQTGLWYFVNGKPSQSVEYMHRALKYAEESDNKKDLSSIEANLGIIYHATGHIPEALEYFNRSLETSRLISNIKNTVSVQINMGILYMDKGIFDKAAGLFDEVLEEGEKIGLPYQRCISLTNIGDIEFERANYENALEAYRASLEMAVKMELPVEEGVNYLGLAKTYIVLKDMEKAGDYLERSFELFTGANELSYLSDYYRIKAYVCSKNSDMDKALEYLEQAEKLSGECDNNLKKLQALRLYGIVLSGLGSFEEAEKRLTQAIELSLEVQSDYQVSKSYYRRYLLYKKTGDSENAVSDYSDAIEAAQRVSSCRFKQDILNSTK